MRMVYSLCVSLTRAVCKALIANLLFLWTSLLADAYTKLRIDTRKNMSIPIRHEKAGLMRLWKGVLARCKPQRYPLGVARICLRRQHAFPRIQQPGTFRLDVYSQNHAWDAWCFIWIQVSLGCGVRANTHSLTSLAPLCSKARAASAAVAPVVMTSSTRVMD
jgi:hypothetical protein